MSPQSPRVQPVLKQRSDLTVRTVSMRQVVAYNLQHARKLRRLTQRELGRHLAELTGKKWNATAVSAAESGWDPLPGRVRSFDVNDLVAFSLALRLPLTWFLLPPPIAPDGDHVDIDETWIELKPSGDGGDGGERDHVEVMTSRFLAWLALSQDDAMDPDGLMQARLDDLPTEGLRTTADTTQEFMQELRQLLHKYQ